MERATFCKVAAPPPTFSDLKMNFDFIITFFLDCRSNKWLFQSLNYIKWERQLHRPSTGDCLVINESLGEKSLTVVQNYHAHKGIKSFRK